MTACYSADLAGEVVAVAAAAVAVAGVDAGDAVGVETVKVVVVDW